MKRISALLLSLLMCASALPAMAFTPETVESVAEQSSSGVVTVVYDSTVTPGVNIATGTKAALTFDEEENAAPGVQARNATGAIAAAPTDASGHDASNVFEVFSLTSRYPHIECFTTVEAERPYYFSFDVYSNRSDINGEGNECLWIIDGNNGSHHNFQNAFGAALKNNAWYTATGTAVYKTEQDRFHIQADALTSSSNTLNGVKYYFDNILIVPYYKVSYMDGEDTLATAYINALAEDGSFLDTLTLDLTKTASITGEELLGWSLNASSETADAPTTVAAAGKDIVLYAVTETVAEVNVTFMNGETNLGTETLTYNELLTKTAFASGKAFKGWSSTADGKTLVTKVPAEAITLYAVFEEIATKSAYGTLLYYNDFSGTATEEKTGLQGWNSDSGDLETMDKYTFYPGNYLNNATTAGVLRSGFATSKGREAPAIVSDPAGTGNPVMRIRQTNNYPRFETYFYADETSTAPTAAPGVYTITYKLYVPTASKNATIYTAINKNNSWSTGTDWNTRGKTVSVTPDNWITVAESVSVPRDYDRLGKLGVFRLGGSDRNGEDIFIDDYAIYYAPSVELTFKIGSADISKQYAAVGGDLPLVLLPSEYYNFLGWSTDATVENIVSKVPATDAVLYPVYEETVAECEHGDLIYHNDFSSAVGTTTVPNDEEIHNYVSATFDDTEVGVFSLRSRFADFANAYDPAGSGNTVLKITTKANNARPTVKFTTPLIDEGVYTFTAKVYVPSESLSKCSLMLWANPDATGGHTVNIWDYVGWKRETIKADEWVTVSRTYRIPEDITEIGQFGLIDSKGNDVRTYYLDDVSVWFTQSAPETSTQTSMRTDSDSGIRFRANIAANNDMTEFGFMVTRVDMLDNVIVAKETAAGESKKQLFYDDYFKFGSSAVTEKANNNFSGKTDDGIAFVGARNYIKGDADPGKYVLNDDGTYTFTGVAAGLNASYTAADGKTYTTRYDVPLAARAYAVVDGTHFYGKVRTQSMKDLAASIIASDSASQTDKAFAEAVVANSGVEVE